jgi:hypothetical protein
MIERLVAAANWNNCRQFGLIGKKSWESPAGNLLALTYPAPTTAIANERFLRTAARLVIVEERVPTLNPSEGTALDLQLCSAVTDVEMIR